MKPASRILLVDDSFDAQLIARAALEDGDFTLETADSATDAYAKLQLDLEDTDEAPDADLILLDILMPEVDGVEACAAIRATRRYRDVPILMVSGAGDRETLAQAFIAGANDYVSKPLNPMELLARVRSALRFKREIDRRRAREAELRSRPQDGTGSIAAAFDAGSGLPQRPIIEGRIAAAAESSAPHAMLLLSVDHVAAHRAERGKAETARLLRRLCTEFTTLSAPLGTTFGFYGDGLYVAVTGHVGIEAMVTVAQNARERLITLALEHGGSSRQDRVSLTAVAGRASGDALRSLPAAMIARAEGAVLAGGGDQIIRMDEDA